MGGSSPCRATLRLVTIALRFSLSFLLIADTHQASQTSQQFTYPERPKTNKHPTRTQAAHHAARLRRPPLRPRHRGSRAGPASRPPQVRVELHHGQQLRRLQRAEHQVHLQQLGLPRQPVVLCVQEVRPGAAEE